MSKELIVSSTRHETRVAILEDDQVVEIFYQREKEYSLAGSIHKGRVTRVLPGMQSAFVDIGLERDAFLYVSDFFEDNEEYDKIVSSVEETVLRLEKTGGAAPAAMAETLEATPMAPADAPPPAPSSQTEARTAPPSAQPLERRDERDQGRGRRSRRRRPKGQGGLPESKYYSPRREDQPVNREPVAPEPAIQSTTPSAGAEESDFAVLPGESLAKYAVTDLREDSHQDQAAAAVDSENNAVHSSPDARQTSPEPDHASRQPQDTPTSMEAPVEASAVRSAREFSAPEPEAEAIPSPQTAPVVPHISSVGHSGSVEVMGHTAFEHVHVEHPFLENRPSRHVEPEPEETPALADAAAEETVSDDGLADNAESVTPEELFEGEQDVAAEATEETPESDGPEPARIPTSLTATLREQGPRFLQHRTSRRMRRKMRGGPQDDRRSEAKGASPAPAETRIAAEPKPVEPETEAKADSRKADRPAVPSISDLLREGQEIIVQIAKEPLGQKGARITSHIALPGRFLVYMPTVDHVGVSRKIPSDDERLRLKKILQTHRTGIPGGYIVRTAGDGKTEEELRADMMFLYNLWMDMRQKAEKRPAPQLMHHDLDVVQRILRDQLTSNFKTIWVDNEEVYESVLRFVQRFQPALVGRVKMYTRTNPVFDEFGITNELEKALRPKVWLKSGGYIVINQTEALVAIDINTGKYVGKSNRLEDTIVKTNTDAIKEIVRQIRLRDLGGIIVVDFIDMDERKNRQKVMQVLEETMRADRAPYKILQFNDFGLVAITRKRVKQSLERTLCAPCPYCEAAGYIKSVTTVIGEILQEAHKVAKALDGSDVTLRVNPEVAKLLKSNHNDYLQEIEEILGKNVLVKSDPLLHQTKFDLA